MVEHAHVQVIKSFRDEHPHALDGHLDGTVDLLRLNAKQELGRLSRLKLLTVCSGRNPEGPGRFGVPILCGLQLPEVDSEGRKSHVRRLRRRRRTDCRVIDVRGQREEPFGVLTLDAEPSAATARGPRERHVCGSTRTAFARPAALGRNGLGLRWPTSLSDVAKLVRWPSAGYWRRSPPRRAINPTSSKTTTTHATKP